MLTGALAWFAARIEEHADWGDHVGFKLAPVDGQVCSVGPPLLLRQVGGVEARSSGVKPAVAVARVARH
ncbi:hypothetical protein [Kitasatospora sp. MAP5-34]|uniref:hypothetical protein n=1 Tax=Kitasatospora sp. MAP5-34 TaxID=3035102 RepID=UPI0032AF2F7B